MPCRYCSNSISDASALDIEDKISLHWKKIWVRCLVSKKCLQVEKIFRWSHWYLHDADIDVSANDVRQI